ncbi:MAG: hypothetical protein AB7O97_05550 [Planctomycetota bacterium]
MHREPTLVVAVLALAVFAPGQSFGYVFSTSQAESTASGSGGTVLQTLRPNEVACVEFSPCPVVSAEKWSPRSCFHTMAGDANNDGDYFEPAMFGEVDALLDILSPVACSSQRTVYWSPKAPMGTFVSGLPGLRPGDTGRIVRQGLADGKVEYFLRAEDLQLALGMPPSPLVVDVDAIAADPGLGVFVSVDGTHPVNLACGPAVLIDGDVVVIPASAITWTADLRVASVVPASASILYSEAQMDAMVTNAGLHDRFGVCITQVLDVEALDIDYAGPQQTMVLCPGNIVTAPTLVFSAETMTGCGLCSTQGGGTIHFAGCGPVGSSCGTPFPTLGDQLGLQPPSTTLGVPSYVNALASTFLNRFVIEPKQHIVNTPSTAQIDVYTPGVFTWLLVKIVPLPVASSFSFPNCFFPDFWAWPPDWIGTPPPGWSTVTTPTIPIPLKLACQGFTIMPGGNIELSTPASIDAH